MPERSASGSPSPTVMMGSWRPQAGPQQRPEPRHRRSGASVGRGVRRPVGQRPSRPVSLHREPIEVRPSTSTPAVPTARKIDSFSASKLSKGAEARSFMASRDISTCPWAVTELAHRRPAKEPRGGQQSASAATSRRSKAEPRWFCRLRYGPAVGPRRARPQDRPGDGSAVVPVTRSPRHGRLFTREPSGRSRVHPGSSTPTSVGSLARERPDNLDARATSGLISVGGQRTPERLFPPAAIDESEERLVRGTEALVTRIDEVPLPA